MQRCIFDFVHLYEQSSSFFLLCNDRICTATRVYKPDGFNPFCHDYVHIVYVYIYPHCFICLMYVYFMYMPSWWKKSLGLHVSYVDPLCCVATVCHQVRCVYWEHLGYFYRAISHLKWRKIVCMGCVACAFIQMKSINMFFMFFHSGVPKHFRWRFIAVWIYNLTVFMYMYVNDLKL